MNAAFIICQIKENTVVIWQSYSYTFSCMTPERYFYLERFSLSHFLGLSRIWIRIIKNTSRVC